MWGRSAISHMATVTASVRVAPLTPPLVTQTLRFLSFSKPGAANSLATV